MQKTGDNCIWYTYDENGLVTGFRYNGAEYYYFRNAQNDIIGIINSSGTVVANYTYDSWGNHISITDGNGNNVASNPNHIANINPFRYRGYYYDTETGLYYLNSRYYDANVGRFLNADGYVSTGQGVLGYNMFAYCLNNPINMADYNGEDAIYVTDYSLKYGVPVVGHAYLFLQDADGTWYVTEFTGNKKSSAKVYVNLANMDKVKEIIQGEKIKNTKYTYISGDFTESLELARNYEGTNYGGYNLFTNNCLHYAKEILTAGKFENEIQQAFANNSHTIIPRDFHSTLEIGLAVGTIKGAIDYVKKALGKIRFNKIA